MFIHYQNENPSVFTEGFVVLPTGFEPVSPE